MVDQRKAYEISKEILGELTEVLKRWNYRTTAISALFAFQTIVWQILQNPEAQDAQTLERFEPYLKDCHDFVVEKLEELKTNR